MKPDRLPPSALARLVPIDRTVLHQGFVALERVTMETIVHGAPARVIREVHNHGDGAAVLTFDPRRRVAVLVRQARAAATMAGGSGILMEAIAGIVEPGEDAGETVRREALEEAGLAITAITPLGHPFSTPGTVTERVHLFLAECDTSATREGGGGVAAEHEEIEVLEVALPALAELSDRGGIEDMKTMLLVEVLRRKRPELFAPNSD